MGALAGGGGGGPEPARGRAEPAAEVRFHALDLLRATMMLLGIVLHAACNYTRGSGEAWGFRDGHSWWGFDLLIGVIHLFRMPTFFLLAGFFGALVHARRGPAGFALNRGLRLGLPLAAGWWVLFPLTVAAFVFAIVTREAGPVTGLRAASGHLLAGAAFQEPKLVHLWFLYHLLLLHGGALLAVALTRAMLPRTLRASFVAAVAGLVLHPGGVLGLAAITAATLLPMRHGGIETQTGFVPPVHVLAAYGVFFMVGWVMHGRAAEMPRLARGWAWRLAVGLVLGTVSLVATARAGLGSLPVRWVPAGLALATWLLVLGGAGFFLRFLNRPMAGARYLADASYWIYLVHLPVVVLLAGLLSRSSSPVVVKFAATVAGTTALCLWSYALFVRPTFLGLILNGRRHPRGNPAAAPPAPMVS